MPEPRTEALPPIETPSGDWVVPGNVAEVYVGPGDDPLVPVGPYVVVKMKDGSLHIHYTRTLDAARAARYDFARQWCEALAPNRSPL